MLKILSSGALASLLMVGAEAARAQTPPPGRLVEPSYTPADRRPASAETRPRPTPRVVPAPAVPALRVLAGDVVIRGGLAEMAEAEAKMVSAVAGRSIELGAIYRAAAELERAYVDAGFVLVRVVVPPQKIVDRGRVEIAVVDGRIEAVDASAVPERVRGPVLARLETIVGRSGLKIADLERAVLIAGGVAGLELRSALARGATEGGVKLVVEGKHRLVQGGTETDNRLSSALGTVRHSAALAINGPFGFGEQWYASGAFTREVDGSLAGDGRFGLAAVGLVLPIGTSGLTFNPEYTSSRTAPRMTAGIPSTRGEFGRLALRSEYPFVRTRALEVTGKAGVEFIRQSQTVPDLAAELGRDDYAVFRAGVEALRPGIFHPTDRGSASLALSQGLGGRDGDKADASGVPLSRQRAEPDFTKIRAELRLSLEPFEKIRVATVLSGQYAFEKALLSAEQFALDGGDAVSGFLPGSFAVDEGVTLRTEIGRSFTFAPWDLPISAAPYVFVAGGAGRMNAPTAVENGSAAAVSAGIGLRLRWRPDPSLPELAFALETSVSASDDPSRRNVRRTTVSAGTSF